MTALYKKDLRLLSRIVPISMLAGIAISLVLVSLANMDVAGALLANALVFFIFVLASKVVNHAEREASFFIMTLPVRLSDVIRSKYILAVALFLVDWIVVAAGLFVGHLFVHFNLTITSVLQGLLLGLGLTLFALSFEFFVYFVFKNYTYAKILLVPILFASSFSSGIIHSSFGNSVSRYLDRTSLTIVGAWLLAAMVVLYGLSLAASLALTKRKDV